MSSLNDWITCFVDASKPERVQDASFGEIKREMDKNVEYLLNLVVLLEPHLTAIKDKERSRASLLLAKLLEGIDQPLTPSQVHHFCVFFNSRLADYPSVAPALLALRVLVENQGRNMDVKYCDVADIFSYMFRELEVTFKYRFLMFDVASICTGPLLAANTTSKSIRTIGCHSDLSSAPNRHSGWYCRGIEGDLSPT